MRLNRQLPASAPTRHADLPQPAVGGVAGAEALPSPHMNDSNDLQIVLEQAFDRPIAFHRAFVDLTGSVTAALLLSQATYWHRRCPRENGWWWKTQTEWEEETGMSRKELDTARRQCKRFLKSEVRGCPPKLWWFLDMAEIGKALLERAMETNGTGQTELSETGKLNCPKGANQYVRKGQIELSETDKSYSTETTAETTSETTANPATLAGRGSGGDHPLDEEPSEGRENPPRMTGEASEAPTKGIPRGKSVNGVLRQKAATLDGQVTRDLIAWWCDRFKARTGSRYVVSGADAGHARNLLRVLGSVEAVKELADKADEYRKGFWCQKVHRSLTLFYSRLNEIRAELSAAKSSSFSVGKSDEGGLLSNDW